MRKISIFAVLLLVLLLSGCKMSDEKYPDVDGRLLLDSNDTVYVAAHRIGNLYFIRVVDVENLENSINEVNALKHKADVKEVKK